MSSNLILGTVIAIALFTAFNVGKMHGLKTAPDYYAFKSEEAARIADNMARWEASLDSTCERIYDMVRDDMNELPLPDDPQRR